MKQKYLRYFVAEFSVILMVVVVFKLIEPRLLAGAVAGFLFVAVGFFVVIGEIRSRPWRFSPTVLFGSAHLFGVALPMMVTRFMNHSLGFSEVRILGLPAPTFHSLSTWVYLGLMTATLVDYWMARRREALKS